jgi:hypothetical protein
MNGSDLLSGLGGGMRLCATPPLSVRAELVEVRDKQPVLRQAQDERFCITQTIPHPH